MIYSIFFWRSYIIPSLENKTNTNNIRYLNSWVRRVSGVTFIRYAQSKKKNGKSNNLKAFGNKKTEEPKDHLKNLNFDIFIFFGYKLLNYLY